MKVRERHQVWLDGAVKRKLLLPSRCYIFYQEQIFIGFIDNNELNSINSAYLVDTIMSKLYLTKSISTKATLPLFCRAFISMILTVCTHFYGTLFWKSKKQPILVPHLFQKPPFSLDMQNKVQNKYSSNKMYNKCIHVDIYIF